MKKAIDTLTKQLNLVILLTLMIALLLVFFVIKPKLDGIKILRIEIAKAQLQREDFTKKLKQLQPLPERISAYQEEIDRFFEVLPNKSEVKEFLVILEDLANKNGILITSIAPTLQREKIIGGREVRSSTGYSTDGFSLSILGYFNNITEENLTTNINFLGFLSDLEKNLRPINVKSIRISGGGEEQQGKPMPATISLEIETYWQAGALIGREE